MANKKKPFESELDAEKRIKAEKKAKTKKKLKIVIPVGAVIFLVLLFFTVCAIKTVKILNPERKKLIYFDGPNEIDDIVYDYFSVDGVKSGDTLIGWYIPAQTNMGDYIETDTVVIMSHTYESSREHMECDGMHIMADLVHGGYDVITFDYSGCCNSAGKNYTFGVGEADELEKIVDYAETLGKKNIILYGFGFGAAPALVEGCRDGRITAIISDSSYTDIEEYMDENLSVWTGLPDFLFSPVIKAMLPVFGDCDMWDYETPYNAVSNAENKSFLFLQASADEYFSPEYAEILNKAAETTGTNYTEYHMFSSCAHLQEYIEEEDNYTTYITEFLAKVTENQN